MRAFLQTVSQLMGLLIGGWLLGSSLVAMADDSEIYTLQTTSQVLGGQGVHVILLIDNSGSFGWCIDQNNTPPQNIPGTNNPDPNCTDDTSTRTFQMRKVVTWFLNQMDPNTSVGLFTYGKDSQYNAGGGSMLAPLRPLNAALANPSTSSGAPLAAGQSSYGTTWKDYLLNWVLAPQQGTDTNSPYYSSNPPTNWLYQDADPNSGAISNLAPGGGTPLLAAYGEVLTYLKGQSAQNNLSGGTSYDETPLSLNGALGDTVFNNDGTSTTFNIFPTPAGWDPLAPGASSFMDSSGTYYPPDDYANVGGSCTAPSWHIIVITDGGANVANGMSQVLPIIGSQVYPGNHCQASNAWDRYPFIISTHGPDGGDQIDYSCAVAEAYYLNNGKQPIPVPTSVATDATLIAPICSGMTADQQCVCSNRGTDRLPSCNAYNVAPETIAYNNGLGVNIHTHVVFIGPESIAGSAGDTNGYNDLYDSFYMSQIADAGGGQFFTVTNYQQLASALASITRQVTYQASTVAAPGVAVNQMNRFNFLDQLYFSEFQPSATSIWQGNLKRYWLHSSDGSNSAASLIVADATGAEALNPATQFFYSTAKSCWGVSGTALTSCLHDTLDGSVVQLGGELQVMPIGPGTKSTIGRPVYISRDNYYTGKDLGHVIPLEAYRSAIVAGAESLTTAQTLFGLSSNATADSVSNLMYWMEGLDLAKSTLNTTPPVFVGNNWMGDPFHSEAVLINYGYHGWSGGGTYGGSTNTSANLAAEQLAAEDPSKQYNYLLVSTNAGDLHAIDAYTGKEALVWVPQEELPLQNLSYGSQQGTSAPTTTSSRTFGLDSTWTVWRHDGNADNYIDPSNYTGSPLTASATNDWVYAYGGMRMGGSSFYALDLTNLDYFFRVPPAGWPALPSQPTPPMKVMWMLQGPLAGGYTQTTDAADGNHTIYVANPVTQNAPASTSAYAFMGQTWSKPTLATIAWGSTTVTVRNSDGSTSTQTVDNPRQVLIFGGGYDPRDETQPYGTGTTQVIPAKTFGQNLYGHQLYIVDAKTGALLFWASGGNPAGSTTAEAAPSLAVRGMNYSITGAVQVMDRDNDGFIDAVYYTDLGGQVWRLDLANSGTNAGKFNNCSGDYSCPSLALGAVLLMQDGESLSGATPSASMGNLSLQRRFYMGVTAAMMQRPSNNLFNANPTYVGLAFGSGNDSHPRLVGTQDRLYLFEDHTLYGAGSLNRATYTPPTTLRVGSSTASNVVNVTNYAYSSAATSTTSTSGSSATTFATLFSSNPQTAVFYIDLSYNTGEKSLSVPTIFNGVVNATTYIPNNTTLITDNACVPQIGNSNFWGFSAFDGRSELNINGMMTRSVNDVGLGITTMSLVMVGGTAVYVGGEQPGTMVGGSLPNNGVMIKRWYQKH